MRCLNSSRAWLSATRDGFEKRLRFSRRGKQKTMSLGDPRGVDCTGYLTDNGAKTVRGCAAMKSIWFLAMLPFLCIGAGPPLATETVLLQGLDQPVEILHDPWGIAHIYAKTQKDLFFAQGFNVARDRLFQLEMWRRLATGTMAEVLGRKALDRDISARLLRLRVDMKEELRHYHPAGEEIINSFVRGINAYIGTTEKDASRLPLEFKLLGIRPGHWTPEVVVSRHNGLYRNAGTEVELARLIALLGKEKLADLVDLHPVKPELVVQEGLDPSLITEKVLGPYRSSFRIA